MLSDPLDTLASKAETAVAMTVEGMDLTLVHALVEAADVESGALIDRIAALVTRTRGHVATQANAALTLMNWHIGWMINVEILQEGRAGFVQEVVATLSPQLSWSHFREIIALPQPEARTFYANEAVTRNLSVRDLRHAVGRKAFERRAIAASQIPDGSAMPLDTFQDPYPWLLWWLLGFRLVSSHR